MATTADALTMSAIKQAASRDAYGAVMTSGELAWWCDVVCSAERFAAMLERPDTIAVIDEEARGLGVVTLADAAYLADVYVERRRRGAGRRIVEALLDHARAGGIRQAECSVMEWNTGAIAFWERIGFRRGRFLTQQIWDPEGLMRAAGEMPSAQLPTAYLGYVLRLTGSGRPS